MDKKIRSMIDSIFADMRMSAENLALRDELFANAIARYEDSLAKGKSEEEAFAEVAMSLEDVRATLIEMGESYGTEKEEAETQTESADESGVNDFAGAFGKAFDAIEDFSRQILPQVGKLAQQADEATGKVFSEFGKYVGKGAAEVGRVAGETIEKIARNIQEATAKRELTEEELLARAKEIRIQAEIRQEADDQEGARQLRRKAYEMEMQAKALHEKKEAAEKEAELKTEDVDEEVDVEAISQDVNKLEEDIRRAIESFDGESLEDDAPVSDEEANAGIEEEGIHFEDAPQRIVVINRFDPTMVKELDVSLDADDVIVAVSDTPMIEVEWTAEESDSTQPVAYLTDGQLKINRKDQDVFKTFLSVFRKEGGKVTIHVPNESVLEYKISTTSGDVIMDEVLTEEITVNSTSGRIHISPVSGNVAKAVSATSISGKVDVEAIAEYLNVNTVSGVQTINANAAEVSLNSVSGRIGFEGAADKCDVESVSGSVVIVYRACPEDAVRISTVSGSAKVVLPEDIQGFKVEMNGISKTVTNDFGENDYGTGELPICFESISGKLIITNK